MSNVTPFVWFLILVVVWASFNPPIAVIDHPSECEDLAGPEYLRCLHSERAGHTEYRYLFGNSYSEYDRCCIDSLFSSSWWDDAKTGFRNHLISPLIVFLMIVSIVPGFVKKKGGPHEN